MVLATNHVVHRMPPSKSVFMNIWIYSIAVWVSINFLYILYMLFANKENQLLTKPIAQMQFSAIYCINTNQYSLWPRFRIVLKKF